MPRAGKKFERSNEGLRDALLAEMEDLRAGLSSPLEAQSFAQLAGRVIESLEVDLKKQRQLWEQSWEVKRHEYERIERARKHLQIEHDGGDDDDDDDSDENYVS